MVFAKCSAGKRINFHMSRLSQFLILSLLFLPHNSEAKTLSIHTASFETRDAILIIGRSTGIPGMFGRFTIVLNGRILSMIGEKQIIKKKVSSGPHILTIRDDVEYRNFAGATVRFSIEPNQKKHFLLILEQKAFESRYRIVAKELKRE